MQINSDWKIVTIIPTFNEELNINSTIRKIPNIVDYIIIIDDGSVDSTLDEIYKIKENRLIILKHKKNNGKGTALVTGFKYILNELNNDLSKLYIVLLDGDGQLDPNLIYPMISTLENSKANVIKGTRLSNQEYKRNMPRFRKIGNTILRTLNSISTGYWNISDPQNGYMIMVGDILSKIRLNKIDNGYYVENSIMHELGQLNEPIIEYAMDSIYNVGEVSSINYYTFIPFTAYKLFVHWHRRVVVTSIFSVYRLLSLISLIMFYIFIIKSLFLNNYNNLIYSFISINITIYFDFLNYKMINNDIS